MCEAEAAPPPSSVYNLKAGISNKYLTTGRPMGLAMLLYWLSVHTGPSWLGLALILL